MSYSPGRSLRDNDSDGEEDDEGSSDGSEEDDSDRVKTTKTQKQVKQLRKHARLQDRVRSTCRSNLALAISVGFWVALFGWPMYSLVGYRLCFGYRGSVLAAVRNELLEQFNETGNISMREIQIMKKIRTSCGPLDTGRMRNIADPMEATQLVPWEPGMSPWHSNNESDVWCGFFNSNFLSYWPNVAQLVIFSVYKNTGTTINLAWQGVIGTFFACANMVFMQTLYPAGAAGHMCMPGSAQYGWVYTVIWHSAGSFHVRWTRHLDRAEQFYHDSGMKGGLDSRALIDGDGQERVGWFINPEMKKKTFDKFKHLRGENCTAYSMVYDSPGFNQWVCLLDVIFVLFLFLISKSATNTIMFGMSWHVCFMMDFMNPNIGVKDCNTWECILANSGHAAVWKTTWFGALIAILATLTCNACLPLSHFRNLYEDSLAVTMSVIRIWENSLEYVCGRMRTAKRFEIETQIVGLTAGFNQAKANAEGAWWETMDHGRWGATRRLLAEYDVSTSDIRDMMNCVRGCVLQEDFKGNHMAYCKKMRPSFEALKEMSEELMLAILAACQDGQISQEEAHDILQLVDAVKAQQRELVATFHEASPDVSMDLAEENIFAFALSFWARKMTDFGERIAGRTEEGNGMRWHKNLCKEFIRGLLTGFVATWSPKRMFEKEHLKFVLRNLLSIGLVFIFGYFVPTDSVFVQYSSTMAGTLTLLIAGDGSHQIGSMVYKNAHRLLGVVLGKVLPIIITAGVAFLPCLSSIRLYIQATTTWLYVFLFTYTYYVSPMWGYVGCLIAGFGVYQLLTPCSGDLTGTFQARYEEIGAVTFAIFVQAIIHSMTSWHSPVELELDVIAKLASAVKDGYKAFFDGDLQAMQAAARDAEAHLARSQQLLKECDPKLKLINCGEPDFKYDLCSQVLRHIDHLLGEFNLLIVAAKDWVPNKAVKAEADVEGDRDAEPVSGVLETLMSRPAMAAMREEFEPGLAITMDLFQMLLHNREVKEVESMHANENLEAAPLLYKQLEGLNKAPVRERHELTNAFRARLTIGVRALENSEYHLSRIAERCLKGTF